jgi:hypothetical protein
VAKVDLGGGTFFDPDKVQEAINHLQAVLDDLPGALRKAQALLHVVAPGIDPLTSQFHKSMQAAHPHDLQALTDLQKKTQNDIANLKAAMVHYVGADEAARYALTAKGK